MREAKQVWATSWATTEPENPLDGGRHVVLGNTTHRIWSVSSLFRSAHAPEQGVHQVHVSSKRVVEF